MYVHQIIHLVYEQFRGLPTRLAEIKTKSSEWFASWGRIPKSIDAFGTGNTCPEIEAYLHLVADFEQGAKGSGRMLSQLVYAEINHRLSERVDDYCQHKLRRSVLKEATEAVIKLDITDLRKASMSELEHTAVEISQMIQAGEMAQEEVNKEIEKRKI